MDVDAAVRRLTTLGYVLQQRSPAQSERWGLLTRSAAVPFELLVVEHRAPLWRRHVWLRDYLRDDPARALHYARSKQRWAARHGVGTPGYKAAKQRFWAAVEDPVASRAGF